MAKRRKQVILAVLRGAVTVGLLSLVLSRVDPGVALSHLVAAPWWALVGPSGLLLLAALLHAVRLQVVVVAAGGSCSVPQVLGVVLRALFSSMFLPTGGSEVVKLALLSRASGSGGAAVAGLVVTRLFELVPWTLLLCWGLSWGLLSREPVLGWVALGFGAAFLSTMATGALALRLGPRLTRRVPGRLGESLSRVADAGQLLTGHRRALWISGLLALPNGAANALAAWVAMAGLGVGLGLGDALALVPAADALINLPVTVHGLGLREGLYVHILAPWGASESLAVAIALLRYSGELSRSAIGGILFALRDTGLGER